MQEQLAELRKSSYRWLACCGSAARGLLTFSLQTRDSRALTIPEAERERRSAVWHPAGVSPPVRAQVWVAAMQRRALLLSAGLVAACAVGCLATQSADFLLPPRVSH